MSPIAPKPADQQLDTQEGAPAHRWIGQVIVALRFVLVPMWVADGRFPDRPGIAAAIPVPNTALAPGAASTTILYVLHF